jgi:hypothetical protein
MNRIGLAVPAALAAATLAGCFTYLVSPPIARVDFDQRSLSDRLRLKGPDTTALISSDRQGQSADETAAAAYLEAAKAILKRAPTAQASANEPPVTSPIPLPRPRPITRP